MMEAPETVTINRSTYDDMCELIRNANAKIESAESEFRKLYDSLLDSGIEPKQKEGVWIFYTSQSSFRNH